MSKTEDIHPEAATAPGYLAIHAARVFSRLLDHMLRPHGLTLALLGPVMLLSWKGPMRQRDLVDHSAVKQPAMVALLSKLEAMALIERLQDEHDGRASKVKLTAKGQETAALGRSILLGANALGTQDFSASEAAMLTSLLDRFIRNLEDHEEQIHHA